MLKCKIRFWNLRTMKTYIFWQNEAFLAKTKLRFWISSSKYKNWSRWLISNFGSSEFAYFWIIAVTFMWKIEHCVLATSCIVSLGGERCTNALFQLLVLFEAWHELINHIPTLPLISPTLSLKNEWSFYLFLSLGK